MIFDTERLNQPFAHRVDTLLRGQLLENTTHIPSISLEEWSVYGECISKLEDRDPKVMARPFVESLRQDDEIFDRVGHLVLDFLKQPETGSPSHANSLLTDLLSSLQADEGLRYLVDLAAGKSQMIVAQEMNDLQRDMAYFGSFNDRAIEIAKAESTRFVRFQSAVRQRATPINPMKEIR